MHEQNLVVLSNKKSMKIGYKRKDALVIASQIREYLVDKGIPLPHASSSLFGRGFKVSDAMRNQAAREVRNEFELSTDLNHMADYHEYVIKLKKKGRAAVDSCKIPMTFNEYTDHIYEILKKEKIKEYRREYNQLCEEKAVRTFTDRETGEIMYDDNVELARAYFALWQCSPATYAIFKKGEHYSPHGITFTCSKHRIDPVWNYMKSKKLRANIYAWIQRDRIHERFQPMHLVLTVPHKDGLWQGKSFYAREIVEKFNLMRKHPLWKEYMHGGLQCLEITRKGKNGLHIHIHAMCLQNPQYDRNTVHMFIAEQWQKHTGGLKLWYETLYNHKRVDKDNPKSAWIMETDENGKKVWDNERQEYKKKKFYLDERYEYFNKLSPEEKLKEYTTGVLECIKYHFKYESFKTGKKVDGTNVDEWDIQLISDVLKNTRSLRMYDKFGALYGVKCLNMSYVEEQVSQETEAGIQAIQPGSDGVEGIVINPFTKKPAATGEYIRVLAMPHFIEHRGQHQGFRPVNMAEHDIYFKIKHDVPIKRVIEAIMKKTYADILFEDEYQRLRDSGYRFKAPREKLFV